MVPNRATHDILDIKSPFICGESNLSKYYVRIVAYANEKSVDRSTLNSS